MPKQRITREMVVDAAFTIAQKDGMDRATVKPLRRNWAVPYSRFTANAGIWTACFISAEGKYIFA